MECLPNAKTCEIKVLHNSKDNFAIQTFDKKNKRISFHLRLNKFQNVHELIIFVDLKKIINCSFANFISWVFSFVFYNFCTVEYSLYIPIHLIIFRFWVQIVTCWSQSSFLSGPSSPLPNRLI